MNFSLSLRLAHAFRGYRLAAALLILPATLFLTACGGDAEPEAGDASAVESPATPVEVVRVNPTSFQETIELTGTVEAPDDAILSAEAAGTLTSLAPLGATIRSGGTVAQINAAIAGASVAQAQASLEAAQAQAELAEDQFRRQEPLYQDSILSALEFQNVRTQQAAARAQVAQARAVLAQTRQQLANTRVTAPFTGVVEERLVERGEQVAPGTPVVRLVSTDDVKVQAGVPERYANDIQKGTSVRIEPTAYGMGEISGTVTFVGSAIDAQSRTFPIEIALGRRAGTLKPEMVTKLYVTRSQFDNVLAVPLAAIVRDERGASLFVAEPAPGEGSAYVARRRVIETGATSNGRVVIESGLQAGERVVVAGQTQIADGDRLRITETPDFAAALTQ